MRLWKYFFIGIAGRIVLMGVHGHASDSGLLLIFFPYFTIVAYLLYRDIRYWLTQRKVRNTKVEEKQGDITQ